MSRHALPRRPSGGRHVRTVLGALLVMSLGLALFAGVRGALIDRTPSVLSDGGDPGSVAANLSATFDDHDEPTPRQADATFADPKVAALTKRELAARKARLAEQRANARDRSLAREAGRLARADAPDPEPAPFAVRIGSFNVLGSQHTAPGGDRRNFPPASVRTAAAAGLIAEHGVDILGTQELQTDQLSDLQSRTGMVAYPGLQWGSEETDNSILYDPNQFQFVSGGKFIIPFMGRPRPQPILRLRQIATGREFYVVNTHPSAHGGRYATERRSGQATLVSIVNQLRQSGLPVLVTGDMNDRELFYCAVVPQTGMTAPNGGGYAGGGCQPPPSPVPVDWVVGGGPITWSDYWRDTRPVTNRTSDHFFVSATAQIS